jgi:hypothetical protein
MYPAAPDSLIRSFNFAMQGLRALHHCRSYRLHFLLEHGRDRVVPTGRLGRQRADASPAKMRPVK